jgi:hypothetical protein
LRSTETNIIDYYVENNVKYLNQKFIGDNDTITNNYFLSDHNNDIYLIWNDEDYLEVLAENSPYVTVSSSLSFFMQTFIDTKSISAENIYGVEILEDGTYNFSILIDDEPYTPSSTTYDYKSLYTIKIKDKQLIKIEQFRYCTQNSNGGDPDFVTSDLDMIEFDYNAQMDFSINEAKRAEMLASNS